MGAEVGVMSGRQVTSEGKQSRDNHGKLHVFSLKEEGGDSTVDTVNTDTIQSLWDSHSIFMAD